MEIINDQGDNDVTAASGMTEPMPPLRSPDAAEQAGLISSRASEGPRHYADTELETRTFRIRSIIEKARGPIGNFIGGAITKTKEFLTPNSRRIALASGVGAIAAGTAINKARSRPETSFGSRLFSRLPRRH